MAVRIGGSYTRPAVIKQDFGALQRGIASTFKPAKKSELKTADLDAIDPIEINGYYKAADGQEYDLGIDPFLIANQKFVDVINDTRDDFQAAHGDKRRQAEIQADMLGYNDVNNFNKAFESFENIDEFDSNLQFFFPDENGSATNINAGEMAKILNNNANALTVAKKTNKNGVMHYGYELDTGSGKVFLSGTNLNDAYLNKNLKLKYNQTGIFNKIGNELKGSRKTDYFKAKDGIDYVTDGSILKSEAEADQAMNRIFNFSSPLFETYESAKLQLQNAESGSNPSFVFTEDDETKFKQSGGNVDLQRVRFYNKQKYLLQVHPEAYVMSDGSAKFGGYGKGYAVPRTEINKNMFMSDTFVPKDQKSDGAQLVNMKDVDSFVNTFTKGLTSTKEANDLFGSGQVPHMNAVIIGAEIIKKPKQLEPGQQVVSAPGQNFDNVLALTLQQGDFQIDKPVEYNLNNPEQLKRLILNTNYLGNPKPFVGSASDEALSEAILKAIENK
jgi:hypothetical protein